VVGAALIAEAIVGPGFERGVLIAVLAGLVVFPAARWAEYRGWIKGDWSPGGTLRKAQDERREREAAEGQPPAGDSAGGEPPDLPSGTSQNPSSAGGDRSPAAGPTSPGDSR
jgi:hypothetical protein